MTAHFNDDRTKIIGDTTDHCATHVGDDVWEVSWLPGRWPAYRAMTAINIADSIAEGMRLGDQRWRQIEHILTSWNVDPSVLDALTEPDDEGEDLS